jgi:type I restriction enzyme S subunit
MKIVKLGDVVLKNSTIKWLSTKGVYDYIDLASVNRDSNTIQQTTKITAKNAPSRAQKIIHAGDVLFGTTRPTLDRRCIIDDGYDGQVCSTGLCVLRANQDKILPEYIFHLLSTKRFKEYVEQAQRGTSYPAVTDSDVKGYEFNLPPLDEQRRVVERLDAAFEKIDRAIELTEENIKNSWYLFDAFRKEKFAGGDITKKLGEVLVLQRGYDLPKSQRVAGEHPLVSSSGIIDNINEYKVQGPGICTGRSGSVGATFYVENNFWPLNTTLYIKDYLGNDPRYCYWLLYGLDLKQFAGGTGVPTLNRNIVHEHMVKMSQGESQKEIANTLDTEYLLCQDLSTKYQKKLSSLKLLKQSLLTQAFSQNEVK